MIYCWVVLKNTGVLPEGRGVPESSRSVDCREERVLDGLGADRLGEVTVHLASSAEDGSYTSFPAAGSNAD